jgi:hypothetical protein
MKDNKLIAEFMEVDGFLSPSQMEYHQSWDWLMPVVEKCLVGEAEQSEEISNTIIKNIYEGICNQDISFTHKSVLEFINEKNKTTQLKATRVSDFDMVDDRPYGVCLDVYGQDGEFLESGTDWSYFKTEKEAEDFCEEFNNSIKTI